MIRGRNLMGMRMVAIDTNQDIGRVKEVIVHPFKKRVVGYLVRRGSWLHKASIVPFASILSYCESTIDVGSAEDVVGPEHVLAGVRLLGRNKIVGTSLITGNGHEIGKVFDVCFNEGTGDILGFEVLTGSSPDRLSGPEFLPIDDDVVWGRDSVLVGELAFDRLLFEATEVGRLNSKAIALSRLQRM
jgi:uncharacterized protein YrrD